MYKLPNMPLSQENCDLLASWQLISPHGLHNTTWAALCAARESSKMPWKDGKPCVFFVLLITVVMLWLNEVEINDDCYLLSCCDELHTSCSLKRCAWIAKPRYSNCAPMACWLQLKKWTDRITHTTLLFLLRPLCIILEFIKLLSFDKVTMLLMLLFIMPMPPLLLQLLRPVPVLVIILLLPLPLTAAALVKLLGCYRHASIVCGECTIAATRR